MKFALCLLLFVAGCTTAPEAPEPVCPTRVIHHKPTARVPYAWEEEVMKPGWHETLYHQGKVIPGIPADYKWDEPTVILRLPAAAR